MIKGCSHSDNSIMCFQCFLDGATNPNSKIKPVPSNPDGWKKFGKAITKLSPKELEDLMKPKNEN